MRAVDAVMECLKAEGVDVVFGLPGDGINGIMDFTGGNQRGLGANAVLILRWDPSKSDWIPSGAILTTVVPVPWPPEPELKFETSTSPA